MSLPIIHSHPFNFRRHQHLDRGWGEIAFEYRWDASDRESDGPPLTAHDLDHCHIYERIDYSGNVGRSTEGWFYPPEPPFVGWRFRDPTDGRTGPVGLECFPASQGWAWDRHKLAGALVIPRSGLGAYRIFATQLYRYSCDLCGSDDIIPGPDAGPHPILRTFQPKEGTEGEVWRYSIRKHDVVAWMDLRASGFVADSAGLDYGPFWLPERQPHGRLQCHP